VFAGRQFRQTAPAQLNTTRDPFGVHAPRRNDLEASLLDHGHTGARLGHHGHRIHVVRTAGARAAPGVRKTEVSSASKSRPSPSGMPMAVFGLTWPRGLIIRAISAANNEYYQ